MDKGRLAHSFLTSFLHLLTFSTSRPSLPSSSFPLVFHSSSLQPFSTIFSFLLEFFCLFSLPLFSFPLFSLSLFSLTLSPPFFPVLVPAVSPLVPLPPPLFTLHSSLSDSVFLLFSSVPVNHNIIISLLYTTSDLHLLTTRRSLHAIIRQEALIVCDAVCLHDDISCMSPCPPCSACSGSSDSSAWVQGH